MRRLNDTYTIVDEIGSGGGGVVYKAYHERLKTYVVVKQIKENVKGILESRAEADILKRLRHAYLPRIYDFLEIDGDIYTVIDYIPGKSLDKLLKEQKAFPSEQVYRWALQLAEVLDYLHRQAPPVIHSDIKPANIMLTPEGDICLIDFNISLAVDSNHKHSVGISGGYSPPEQYRSMAMYRSLSDIQETVNDETVLLSEKETDAAFTDIKDIVGRGVDERSDIYSLGATLYHLLTGAKPEKDFERIVPIDQYQINMSEGFRIILKKMMQLCPENRYQNGGELLEAFHHIYELDTEYREYKNKRRRMKLTALALLFSGILLLAFGTAVRHKEKNTLYYQNIDVAEQAIENGNFEDAEKHLEMAKEIFSQKIDAYEKEALRQYQMGEYEKCVHYISRLMQDPPFLAENEDDDYILAELYYIAGHAFMEMEDYSNAALNLKNAVRLDQSNSVYFRDYALSQAKEGSVDEAESALQEAVQLGLGEDSIYMVQGEIAFAKGESDAALEYLEKTIRTSVDAELRHRAVLLCDDVYKEKGNSYLDEEIAFLEQEEGRASGSASVMSLTERLADAYARKAEVDIDNQEKYYQKSLEKCLTLYESGYSTRQMMENLAIVYQALGEYDHAEEMLFAMTEKYPDSYISYKRLAYMEAERQQEKDIQNRDYSLMKEYYDRAKELYGVQDTDQEMQMLDNLIQDLKDGNWL